MDNRSDDTIRFDSNGYCNYCTDALKKIGTYYCPGEQGKSKLNDLLSKIKHHEANKKYDCIMGLSGGLDSSYLAYLGYKWGLRVLAVHIDDGYDTDISKRNLEKLIARTGFDYEVITPDPEQFNALTLAYMRAGVPNIAVPQDNILLAFLYKQMKQNGLSFFLSGSNFSLESILQAGNTHRNTDVVNLRDINKRFGTTGIDKLEFISTTQRAIDRRLRNIRTERPLNYVDYTRDRAFSELADFCDYQYYGRKHLENILTAFIQLVWLPEKFNVDKRTSHLSSMIISNQITRDEALQELQEPLYDSRTMREYIELIKSNMHLSDDELDSLLTAPTHQHDEYKTEDNTFLYKSLMRIYELNHKS